MSFNVVYISAFQGLQRQHSAIDLLQAVESYCTLHGLSCALNASSFTVDVRPVTLKPSDSDLISTWWLSSIISFYRSWHQKITVIYSWRMSYHSLRKLLIVSLWEGHLMDQVVRIFHVMDYAFVYWYAYLLHWIEIWFWFIALKLILCYLYHPTGFSANSRDAFGERFITRKE